MRRRTGGLSLVIVLLLLAGLMLLVVSGFAAAIAAVSLAGLDEQSALAFEVAEAGITRTLRDATPLPGPLVLWPVAAPGVVVETALRYDDPSSQASWAPGFSIGSGAGGFLLRHGSVLATGRAGRGTLVRIEQGFATLAPDREVTQ